MPRKVSNAGDAFARVDIKHPKYPMAFQKWIGGYIWYPLAPCKLNNNMIWICFEPYKIVYYTFRLLTFNIKVKNFWVYIFSSQGVKPTKSQKHQLLKVIKLGSDKKSDCRGSLEW